MAKPMTASQIERQFKKWGVPYEFWTGAVTRGNLPFAPIGVVIHHTGGAFTESKSYLDFLFIHGRPGIPGPLCNFSGGPSGKIYVGALQEANHAGRGDWTTRQKVGAENYPGYRDEINPGSDDYGTGNQLYYGLEINYPGTVKMKSAQYKSAVRMAAAICDFYGWTALSVIGHREHSSRKWDPGQAPMDEFRKDVRDLLAAGPSGSGGSMADYTRSRAYSYQWRTDNKMRAPKGRGGKYWWPETVLELCSDSAALFLKGHKKKYYPDEGKISLTTAILYNHSRLRKMEEETLPKILALLKDVLKDQAGINAQLAVMKSVVEQHAAGGGISIDTLTSAAREGASEAMSALDATITLEVTPSQEPSEDELLEELEAEEVRVQAEKQAAAEGEEQD